MKRIDVREPEPDLQPITRLSMNVAQDCNLRCRYCLVGQGVMTAPRQLMSREVARRAIDFLLQVSGESRMCRVGFFGGEPMLNFAVIKAAVEYGQALTRERGKEMEFTIITNGTLFNEENLLYIKRKGITVGISIDGPPSVHDRMRPFADRRGSYATVRKHLPRLLDGYDDKVHARTVITRHAMRVVEIIEHLTDLGFREIRIGHVWGEEEGHFLDPSVRQELKEAYSELARFFLARKTSICCVGTSTTGRTNTRRQ